MISVQNLKKLYGKKAGQFIALDDVSFTIPTGTTAAIIGKSGSGKSTLMHIIGGLDHPTSGKVVINDKELGTLKRAKMDMFRAKELGFVFQSFFIEGNQTCYQNVSLPLEINKVSRRSRKKLVTQALQAVDLGDKINEKAKNLSGGGKQRLAIARAIVLNPKLIMADEPTGNLDSATGEKIIQLLFGLNKSTGATLIIVTHDRELAARCQMQVELKDGRVVSLSTPKTQKKANLAPRAPRRVSL
jgi:putative ABC transport system ATP-binding protein